MNATAGKPVPSRRAKLMLALSACALALAGAGCGSSAGLTQSGTDTTASAMAMTPTTTSSTTTASGMSGMSDMSGTTPTANGTTAIPIRTLATTTWQHMRISAQEMTPVPFYFYQGSITGSGHYTEIRPTRHTSFHLMVMLDDARTNVTIPYATVWVTILRAGRVVYDQRMWPMIAEYMGPHYGNDVSLPGAGHYTMRIQVDPPTAARHVEYSQIWLQPHTVTVGFDWRPSTA